MIIECLRILWRNVNTCLTSSWTLEILCRSFFTYKFTHTHTHTHTQTQSTNVIGVIDNMQKDCITWDPSSLSTSKSIVLLESRMLRHRNTS